ncbi:MAG: hypothetical protein ABID38_06460 [Candidatus Diapherotrites archaeon]
MKKKELVDYLLQLKIALLLMGIAIGYLLIYYFSFGILNNSLFFFLFFISSVLLWMVISLKYKKPLEEFFSSIKG